VRVWRGYLVAGLVALVAYPFIPDKIAQDAVYVAIGLSAALAMVLGLRVNRPDHRAPWLYMIVGQLIWTTGDILDSWNHDVVHSDAFPALSDVFYLAAYPVFAVGLAYLIRGRRARRDIGGLLDSAIVTAGLGLLSWVLLARPTLEVSHQSFAAATVSVAYPVGDILLVGFLIRLITTPGARTASFRLLLGAVTLLIAADTASAALSVLTSGDTGLLDLVWLASYLAWGAAALHPSMRTLSESTRARDLRFTRARLACLMVAALIPPAVFAVESATGSHVDTWAIICASVLLLVLVVWRMGVTIDEMVEANKRGTRLQHDLAHQAAHDVLTGLPNRAQAMRLIDSALERAGIVGSRVGLLFIDLDGFKNVNDTMGHRAGDLVLLATARRLSAALRSPSALARLGGDEFVAVLDDVAGEADALLVANRLVDAAAEPITLGAGQSARVGASIGVSVSRPGDLDAERLLHEADTAVYRAKAGGRRRAEVFDDRLRVEIAERESLEAALRRAISGDELTIHYQPVIEAQTGTLRSYEALVRWNRPGYGLVAPAEFIPAAEATVLICDLDAWVMRTATSQLADWIATGAAGGSTKVAVNISARHVSSPRILTDVAAALAYSGLPATNLVLEITETGLTVGDLAIAHLHQLREQGITVCLDDFGTGYSSIGQLRLLPIDVIKIDRSFLSSTERSARSLIELMVEAAHACGLPVVAERVENLSQLRTLQRLDCDFAQGFLIAEPLPADEAAGLIAPVPPASRRTSPGPRGSRGQRAVRHAHPLVDHADAHPALDHPSA
jgi:diguanylate cyclase (GGDEF)-like protein